MVAIQLTSAELWPSNHEQAEQLAMVVKEVFYESPMPDTPSLTRHATLLEAFQTDIATRLAVLDDASLTGTGQSAADTLGVPGTVVARTLTSYLLREIVARGVDGGPLFPLACQLNHDQLKLENEQIKRMIGDTLERLARLEETLGEPSDP
jgi:hypothetical protein